MNKEKLIELIDSNGRFNLPTCELEALADYLIANGIGDISSEKHRADVMEWALRKRCKSPCDSGYYCTLDEDLRAECVGKYDYKNCYKYHIRQAERVERIRNYSRPAIVAICR